MKYKVYVLRDDAGLVRYVGYTSQRISQRLTNHLSDKTTNHRTCWIKSLKNRGVRPSIEEIETFENLDAALEAEMFYISYLRYIGCELTNSTDGGEGSKGHTPRLETKIAISKSGRGKKRSVETKQRISKAMQGNQRTLGRKHSILTKEKIRQALKGNKNGLGVKHSVETRMKIEATKRQMRESFEEDKSLPHWQD